MKASIVKLISAKRAALMALTGIIFLLPTALIAAQPHPGKIIAFDRSKGNCLACHVIDDGQLPGNAGPPLMNIKQRYPDRKALRSQIWDATAKNPISIMPPFGRHRILSESEIDLIVDYLYTL